MNTEFDNSDDVTFAQMVASVVRNPARYHTATASDIVQTALDSSVGKRPSFLRSIADVQVTGTDKNPVITADLIVFDGGKVQFQFTLDPVFGGWGYMCKSAGMGGPFHFDRAAGTWRRLKERPQLIKDVDKVRRVLRGEAA